MCNCCQVTVCRLYSSDRYVIDMIAWIMHRTSLIPNKLLKAQAWLTLQYRCCISKQLSIVSIVYCTNTLDVCRDGVLLAVDAFRSMIGLDPPELLEVSLVLSDFVVEVHLQLLGQSFVLLQHIDDIKGCALQG